MQERDLKGSAASTRQPVGSEMEARLRLLFVTWDGPQVSYVESLFLPIFARLAEHGFHFDILQFRWGGKGSEEQLGAACRAAGIGYRAVPIWRWGGGAGPFLSALLGGRHVRSAARAFGSDIVMPRSLMPAIAALAAGGPKLRPLLFDSDGLAVDERVDVAGLPATGLTYRVLRDVEAQAVRRAASVLVRTKQAAEILFHRAGPPVTMEHFHIVANGRDERIFQPFDADTRAEVRRRLSVGSSSPLLVYAGSLGPQYGMDAMRSFFVEVRRLRADARFLVLTGNLDRAVKAFQSLSKSVIIMRVPPEEVPKFLAAADVGLAYRSPIFSMQGVAPIKLSEYLLCGLPVIGTASVGDTKKIVDQGLFLNDESGTPAAARWFLEEVLLNRDRYRTRARAAGRAQFSLARSVEDYGRALQDIRTQQELGGFDAPLMAPSTDR